MAGLRRDMTDEEIRYYLAGGVSLDTAVHVLAAECMTLRRERDAALEGWRGAVQQGASATAFAVQAREWGADLQRGLMRAAVTIATYAELVEALTRGREEAIRGNEEGIREALRREVEARDALRKLAEEWKGEKAGSGGGTAPANPQQAR